MSLRGPVSIAGIALALVSFAALSPRLWNAPELPPDPRLPRSELLRGFRLLESLERRDRTLFTLARGESVLRIEAARGIPEESAPLLIEEGILGIEALYSNALSPYPEEISNRIVVNEKFRPRFRKEVREGRTFSYFLLFSNDRFGYGAGAEDSVKHKSLLGWLYCEGGETLYKVSYFTSPTAPDEALEELFLTFRCP